MGTLPDTGLWKGTKVVLKKSYRILFVCFTKTERSKLDEYYTEMIKGVIENYAYR